MDPCIRLASLDHRWCMAVQQVQLTAVHLVLWVANSQWPMLALQFALLAACVTAGGCHILIGKYIAASLQVMEI